MFQKRLIHVIPNAMSFVKKQVFMQWIALVCNIIFTFMICSGFVLLVQNQLTTFHIVMAVIILILLFVIRSLAFKKAYHYSWLGASLVKMTLREKLFKKVLSLGNHYQDYVKTSELVQLGVEGINQLETYFSLYLPQLFYSLIAPITLFIVLSFYDFMSALVLFLCVPLIPLSIVLVQKFAKKLLAKYWHNYTTLGDSFLENLQGLTTLKIYQSDQYKHNEMNKEAENFRKMTMRVLIMQLNSISIMDIVAYGGAGLGSYLAVMHYMNDQISLFVALFIVLLSFEFFIPLRQLGSFFHIAMNGIAAADKLFDVLDKDNKSQGFKDLDQGLYDIHIKDLSFQYDNDKPLLKNVHMDIFTHQWIGIVGESGSGKSTIAKLIMGYYSQYDGNLLIQDKERKDIKDESFLKEFVYVTHDPMIFKGTLRDNLDLLNEYQDNQLWEVLSRVQLKEFVINQGGLDMLLLEGGHNLSGGQKQRLNLARALLKDASVYIFDEATSSVDVESENHILKMIADLAQTKTVIMITHRLSSVVDCDYIYVMKDGQLVEKGNHLQLMQQRKDYENMFKKQEELEVYQA